ncbi:hypothetical protein CK203_027364 [Vitis vinifera]|uniref:Uncharacterized protein n=1 Tax=Vitis vinifera TaxID=29760 RepID=A0A438J9D6_VITVI|nr:hypothetical protein CK203_027364 [Vitis vinifera]
MELKRIHEVQAVTEAPVKVKLCPNCQSYEHLVEKCPAISVERKMYRDQANSNSKSTNSRIPISTIFKSLNKPMANLSKVVGDFVEKQEATNAQINQRIDRVESMLNKRMDGMQNDMNQKFDNIQYSISRLTKFEYTARKGKISFSTPPKTQMVSMK